MGLKLIRMGLQINKVEAFAVEMDELCELPNTQISLLKGVLQSLRMFCLTPFLFLGCRNSPRKFIP
jgi:hypothetical protein